MTLPAPSRQRPSKPLLIWFIISGLIVISAIVIGVYLIIAPAKKFDGQLAYSDVKYQVSLGPRTPDSQAHSQVIGWINTKLKGDGWAVDNQIGTFNGHNIHNIIDRRGSGNPWIILGAHYDSRLRADQDANLTQKSQSVPGANDGASGVSVLLEIARVLPRKTQGQVWLVFFDAEDQGDLPGWDWIQGSRYFASQLKQYPDAVVVIDMIGDAHLNIYMEKNSDKTLNQQIWTVAKSIGYESEFIPQYNHSMLDDHIPFIERKIPAVDLIDFDYPYWHTSQDTPDKVSPFSLKVVGDTLIKWMKKGQ